MARKDFTKNLPGIVAIVLLITAIGMLIFVTDNPNTTSGQVVVSTIGKANICLNNKTSCSIRGTGSSTILSSIVIDDVALSAATSCLKTMGSDTSCLQKFETYSDSCSSTSTSTTACSPYYSLSQTLNGKCTIATGTTVSSNSKNSFTCTDYTVVSTGLKNFKSTFSRTSYNCDGMIQTLNGITTYYAGTTCKFSCAKTMVSHCFQS